jgi:dTDP-4-dehydrorhamnose reductase
MSHTTRILVTGGNGILATALRGYFPLAVYHGSDTCNVTDPQQTRSAFREVKPELVIHCAALTAHDAEPSDYSAVNLQGTVNAAVQARKFGARFVFLSTDYLSARRESDPVSPVNAYAASKYAGESVALGLEGGLVIRGSWYSRLDYSHAATDAYTSKIPVEKAAYYVATLAVSGTTGIVNIGGRRRSIYEIALEWNPSVIPISRTQVRCGYEIPADCSLDTTRLTGLMAA